MLLVVVDVSGGLIIIVTISLQRLLLDFLLLLPLTAHVLILWLLVEMLLDLCLRCIDIVIGFYLDVLEHLLIVLVIHGKLVGELLFTEFFTNDGLVLLLVVGALVSLMVANSLSGLAALLALELSLLYGVVSPAVDLLLAVLSLML